jgi:FMN-dependent NADH-azoreductase
MKKLLYITCNSKPEELSASKSVGREFVNSFLQSHGDFELKELDLYESFIPKLHYKYFKDRNSVVDFESEAYLSLSEDEKRDVGRIVHLSKQFKEADFYVIAAPMWSLMFPARLMEYLDCIIQNDITIKVSPKDVEGLLDDKERTMVYVQSSGGGIPWLIGRKMNHGGAYLKDIFKFLGIKHFHEVLVDGTGFTEKELHKAVEDGKEEARTLATKL